MQFTETVEVAASANVDTLKDVYTAPLGKRTIIKEIWFQQGANSWLIGYVNQRRVVQVSADCNQADYLPVAVNMELPPGQTLKVGFTEKSGADQTLDVTVVFDEADR